MDGGAELFAAIEAPYVRIENENIANMPIRTIFNHPLSNRWSLLKHNVSVARVKLLEQNYADNSTSMTYCLRSVVMEVAKQAYNFMLLYRSLDHPLYVVALHGS